MKRSSTWAVAMAGIVLTSTTVLTAPAAMAVTWGTGLSYSCAAARESVQEVTKRRAPANLFKALAANEANQCADPATGYEPQETPVPSGDWRATQLAYLNATRAKKSQPRLQLCPALNQAAQGYAQKMANTGHYSHTGPNGSSPGDRIRAQGYQPGAWGENIAYGYDTSEAVTSGWITSTGHYENIISRHFRYVGMGAAAAPGDGTLYWVQNFGGDTCPGASRS